MTLQATTAAVVLAVKNGPPDMWRASGGAGGSLAGVLASWPVLAFTVGASIALAVLVVRRYRHAGGAGLAIPTALLWLLVVAELVTHAAVLTLLVPVLLTGLWVAALRRSPPAAPAAAPPGTPPSQRTSRPASSRTAEVIDLARWRADRETRRRAGSR